LAPWIAPHAPNEHLDVVALKFQPPSARFWFGTDSYSRDVLSRMLYGARVSLSIAILAAVLSAVVGLTFGAIAGYVGGTLDSFMMRFVDAMLAIPRVLLLITIIALWGEATVTSLVFVLGLTGWFGVSRLARGEALATRRRDFVAAARALGASHARVLVRHVIPHVMGPVLVAAAITVSNVIVLEAGLSYLGLGLPAPAPSWGNIIQDGYATLATTWWMTVIPGVALIISALAANTVADRLRAALNPRQLPAR
jgi:peptide/nickel transport system permease protein